MGSVHWWTWFVVAWIGFILPFAMFASGVALERLRAHSRHLARMALATGIAFGSLSYVLTTWVEPELHHAYLTTLAPATAERIRFGPQTPAGILRNLRFVEANPPEEYSTSVDAPHRRPPNVLRWVLHGPAAWAVFGLINLLLGMLAARVTVHLRRQSRRNARIAIGVLGGIAFFVCVGLASPIQPFLRDGTLRSGVLSAWIPLAFPLTEALLLCYLIRRTRG
jgi:lipopolysaccharide export LptBFGC system permease protein LptF